MPLVRPDDATPTCVSILDALAQSVLCQSARHSIATIDSALNKKLVSLLDVREMFAALPARYRILEQLIDARAESGPETLVRLMLRTLGCTVEPQVEFDGIGRVDHVVDGWLVVECDSKQFHATWEQQVKDRERDLALASLGFATIRFTAAQIMYQPDEVFIALRALARTHRTQSS